jgi:hypothetical protein
MSLRYLPNEIIEIQHFKRLTSLERNNYVYYMISTYPITNMKRLLAKVFPSPEISRAVKGGRSE